MFRNATLKAQTHLTKNKKNPGFQLSWQKFGDSFILHPYCQESSKGSKSEQSLAHRESAFHF